ncbi:MAG: hypothetical protein K2W96_25735 [Gemmataceae bacterium]|nr:hypothetical protein [Gemmataceae bacterium]
MTAMILLAALGAPMPAPATARAECLFEAGTPGRATALMQFAGSPGFRAQAGLGGAKLALRMNGTTVLLTVEGVREGAALDLASAAARLVIDEPGKSEMASLASAFAQARTGYDDMRFGGRRAMKCGLGIERPSITDPSQMPDAWQIRVNRPALLVAPRLTGR